jgi:hypothetical protein
MKAKYFMYALILLSSMASARDQFSCDKHFGENLQIITEQVSIKTGETVADLEKGDFNGDGLKDKVVILKLNIKSKFDNSVTLLNPPTIWPKGKKLSDRYVNADKVSLPDKDTIALGIIQSEISGKKCHKFVIYNTDYFPASEAKSLFVHVVLMGENDYTDIQKHFLGDLRYDVIALGSWAPGLIYWSNGKYIFDLPSVDPNWDDE